MDRNRPLIGICAYEVPAAFSHWRDVTSVMIPSGYTRSVHDAGGLPLVLPPFEDNTELLDLLDGLIFSGGPDIGPDAYGAAAARGDDAGVAAPRPRRDRDDARGARPAGAGARHLPRDAAAQRRPRRHAAPASRPTCSMTRRLTRRRRGRSRGTRSRSSRAPGSGRSWSMRPSAHSCHHQAPERIGDGLTVSARAADGVVEGLELREHPFAVGRAVASRGGSGGRRRAVPRAGRGRGRVPGVPGGVALLDGAIGGADRLDQLVEADALLQAVGRAGRQRRFDHLRLVVG